ncbi:MAG: pentapeptide repeat-containing protein [Alphaproteobacteria bacterium]
MVGEQRLQPRNELVIRDRYGTILFSSPEHNAEELAHFLKNAAASGLDISDANLSHTVIAGKAGDPLDLSGLILRNGRFHGVVFSHVIMSHADLRHGDFFQARLHNVEFDGTKLADANFNDVSGHLVSFDRVRAPRCTFYRADLHYPLFRQTMLAQSDFRAATLLVADFEGADLTRSKFSHLHITDGIYLADACLRYADIQTPFFSYAGEDGYVDMRGTDLRDSKGLYYWRQAERILMDGARV